MVYTDVEIGNPCRENVCGKGSCVTTENSTFGFECECQHGWKQARSQDDEYLKFLPCVIPNCESLSLSPSSSYDWFRCVQTRIEPASGLIVEEVHATPPLRSRTPVYVKRDITIYSIPPLSHATKNLQTRGPESILTYEYLLSGAIGLDCPNLGLNMMASPPPSPILVDDSKSHAASLIPGAEFGWLIMATTLALAVWKHI
ncbi:UNVERIFIED_CONTAM: hypothetical protein Scaly_2845100 [Sesamum calycinum]|uniref:EGF-like domain-containing protein n=1 Tax=Sesamum calycinum TaxID=2727403 RepID=A0AAW2IS05_9LAMI